MMHFLFSTEIVSSFENDVDIHVEFKDVLVAAADYEKAVETLEYICNYRNEYKYSQLATYNYIGCYENDEY
jgi:hypothetical protein